MKLFPGTVTGTYGADKGLWELAAIRFQEDGQWEITYKTKITGDVLGWLSRPRWTRCSAKSVSCGSSVPSRFLRRLAPALEPEKFNNLLDWFRAGRHDGDS